MKKFLFGIATFVMMAVLCVVFAGAETYGDYTYTVLSDGTVEITGYTGSATELEIPSEIDGKKVTSIGEGAFSGCKSLTSVTIPDSVTSIGDYAFASSSSLESVTISDSVTSINCGIFAGCEALTTVNIPDNITSIGENAFADCWSLESIIIPDSVTSIGSAAFCYCTSLKSITIPDGVTGIGYATFAVCTSLKSVTIPDSVTSIGDNAFSGCSSLTSVTIPDGVTSIDYEVFAGCESLTTVNIPDDVTSIGDKAFAGCWSLESVIIPQSVTSIGDSAFRDCSSLASITIPNGVTGISYSAFSGCTSLTSITIPNSVTSIGESAFKGCSSLTSITIPNRVTNIDDYAFYLCENLVISCYTNSTAHQYAVDNGIKCKLIDAPPAPSAVESFRSPSKSTTAIRLNWTANDTADGYIIEQYTNSGWIQIADITDSATTTYKVTGLIPGTAYKFRMRAYNPGGESKNTATLTANTMMTAVKNFRGLSNSTTAIYLYWTENAYATGYIIEQFNGSAWVQMADITDGATTGYKVTDLNPGTAYKFRMRAYSVTKYGVAIYGEKTATITVNTQAPSVSGFGLKSRSDKALRLKWTKNTAVDGYVIEQYINSKWVEIADIDSYATTEYKVTGLSASTKYLFRMKTYAITKYGEKTYSAYTKVVTSTTSPSAVSGLRVKSRAKTAVRLAWNQNDSAYGYVIEQNVDGKWVQVAHIRNNGTLDYRIDGLTSGTEYQFRMRAYNPILDITLYSDYKTISATTLS